MNKQRRKEINAVIDKVEAFKQQIEDLHAAVEAAHEEIERIRDEEQEYFDGIPESLQQGEKATTATESIDLMAGVMDSLDALKSALSDFDPDACVANLDEAKGGSA